MANTKTTGMNKKEYLSNAMQEIEALKKHATKEEIENLDFETFDPRAYSKCIYGQMTGDCHSSRALRLIRKCTPVVINEIGGFYSVFSDIKENINGKPTRKNIHSNGRRFFSTLENYIVLIGAKNEEIIQYLKGETKTLKL